MSFTLIPVRIAAADGYVLAASDCVQRRLHDRQQLERLGALELQVQLLRHAFSLVHRLARIVKNVDGSRRCANDP